uniref:Uncharacterized protein n=1 Tax=Arundo donax TaxID=35708 RepID=A0A0A9DQE1_ARUDO
MIPLSEGLLTKCSYMRPWHQLESDPSKTNPSAHINISKLAPNTYKNLYRNGQ